jgi:hypothetical protein
MLTKLDAVNAMLASIGEAPVASLTSPSADTTLAETKLEEVRADVLAAGWAMNTDNKVTLTRDVSGHILVPADAITVDTVGTSRHLDVVIRVDSATSARKLWDRASNTFVFATDVLVRVVRDFPFDQLDHHLRRYITAEATVRFQANVLGSNSVDKRLRDHRDDAWSALQDAEAEQEDLNVLTGNPHCAWIAYRYNPLFGV